MAKSKSDLNCSSYSLSKKSVPSGGENISPMSASKKLSKVSGGSGEVNRAAMYKLEGK